jgi:hypothetical protein
MAMGLGVIAPSGWWIYADIDDRRPFAAWLPPESVGESVQRRSRQPDVAAIPQGLPSAAVWISDPLPASAAAVDHLRVSAANG